MAASKKLFLMKVLCVTALVAFDLLVSIDLLSEKINDVQRQEFIEIVRPLIIYLKNSDETHAIISIT